MSIANRKSRALIDAKLQEANCGIGSGHLFLILGLYRNDNISQHDLAGMYYLDKAVVSRDLTKLESMGYVARKSDPNDQRRSLISLTESGRALVPGLYDILASVESRLKEPLTEEEVQMFLVIMRKLLGVLTEEIDRKRTGPASAPAEGREA